MASSSDEFARRARRDLGPNATEEQIAAFDTVLREAADDRKDVAEAFEYQIWRYGLPRLVRVGGSRTPSTSHHEDVVAYQGRFVHVVRTTWKQKHRSGMYSASFTPEVDLEFCSEADIVHFVRLCLQDVMSGLAELDQHNIALEADVTMASLRRDIVVFRRGSVSIGYCEVKQPDFTNRDRVLDNNRVLGQV